jgi:hypothetical protein
MGVVVTRVMTGIPQKYILHNFEKYFIQMFVGGWVAGKVKVQKKSIENVSLVVAVGPHPCRYHPYGKRN